MIRILRAFWSFLMGTCISVCAYGQFYDCTSGLLQNPSAEMNLSGTFMITNNYLNKHTLASRMFGYDTFSYGFDLTVFSRVEVAYVCTILDGKRRPNGSERDKIMFNQDRHFSAKFLLLRENDFGKSWIPSVAVGVCDPVSGYGGGGNYGEGDVTTDSNGFFNRMYIVATKHFDTGAGIVGGHIGYQYNLRNDPRFNAPCAAVDWAPIWLQKERIVTTRLIAEYDARTFNAGAIVSIWRDHFEAMVELQALKWLSAGVRYKVVLK